MHCPREHSIHSADKQEESRENMDDGVCRGTIFSISHKLVCIAAIWSIILFTDVTATSLVQAVVFLLPCIATIIYDIKSVIFTIQEYFHSLHQRKTSEVELNNKRQLNYQEVSRQALQTLGIVLLFARDVSQNVLNAYAIGGLTCLYFYVSLTHTKSRHVSSMVPPDSRHKVETNIQKSTTVPEDNEIVPAPTKVIDARVDRVYTIGCFDLFHYGHIVLMENMRKLGKQVIVGVHDTRSIYMLKRRIPVDSTHKRMLNVKRHADIVFCVAGTDPTLYLEAVFSHAPGKSMYVRGDDMPNFPARDLCERLMTVRFLPYTQGVSSTQIRQDLMSKEPDKKTSGQNELAQLS